MLILVSNVGLAFNVHYCGGKITGVSFASPKVGIEKDCCGKPIKKSICCKDKKVKLEKKTDNSVVKSFSFQLEVPFSEYTWKPINDVPVANFNSNKVLQFSCDAHAPPLYKLYSQYIFYA